MLSCISAFHQKLSSTITFVDSKRTHEHLGSVGNTMGDGIARTEVEL
jgi:hypothetical protein